MKEKNLKDKIQDVIIEVGAWLFTIAFFAAIVWMIFK